MCTDPVKCRANGSARHGRLLHLVSAAMPVLVSGLWTGSAAADVTLQLRWAQPLVVVPLGETVQVPIVLRETTTSGSTSVLLAEAGLFSVGLSIARESPPPINPSFMVAASMAPNVIDFFDAAHPVFGSLIYVAPTGDMAQWLLFARYAGVTGIEVAPGVREVALGSIPLRAGIAVGQSTRFTLGDFDAFSDDTLTWSNLLVLDTSIAGSILQVNTVLVRCPADFTAASDPADPTYGFPDGIVDGSDFFFYLDQFELGDLTTCDLTGASDPSDPSYGIPDGQLNISDFFYYLDLFVIPCP